jgi:hypothetical protein
MWLNYLWSWLRSIGGFFVGVLIGLAITYFKSKRRLGSPLACCQGRQELGGLGVSEPGRTCAPQYLEGARRGKRAFSHRFFRNNLVHPRFPAPVLWVSASYLIVSIATPFLILFFFERVRRKRLFGKRSCRSLSRHMEQDNKPDDDEC